jgi:hypothetical protein
MPAPVCACPQEAALQRRTRPTRAHQPRPTPHAPAATPSCLNAKSLGETKNVNLPGVHVDMLVLTDKDLADVRGLSQTAPCLGGRGRLGGAGQPGWLPSRYDVRTA